jgi:hypothetical protein
VVAGLGQGDVSTTAGVTVAFADEEYQRAVEVAIEIPGVLCVPRQGGWRRGEAGHGP